MDRRITNTQVEALETEAGTAGDLMQAAICQVALYGEVKSNTLAVLSDAERTRAATFGRASAREECQRVIDAARAMED